MSQPPDPSQPPPYPEAPRPEPAIPAPPAAPPAYPGEPAHPAPRHSPAVPQYPPAAPPHPPAAPTRPATPQGTPPAYPTPSDPPPAHPGAVPTPQGPPSYPTAAFTPTAPPSAPPPAYPTAAPAPSDQPPAYPSPATAPQGLPPAYPSATPTPQGTAPAYPAAAPTPQGTPPAYPTTAFAPPPPAYPVMPPAPPGPPSAHPVVIAPPHPGGPPAHAPAYPAAYPPAQPVPGPAHPGLPGPPAAGPAQPGLPAQPPRYPGPDAAGEGASPPPDDLDYRHRGARVHVSEYQRGVDATAIGRLAVQVPGALVSLGLVCSIALGVFGTVVGTAVVLAWVASGLLVFHRPTERAFARYVLKLRPPTAQERARLEPVWNEVIARAGIEPGTYELMVENSDELNAAAVAGHVVGVTTYSLAQVPSSNLAAVLAHELGHHTGGHAWAGLLGYWYSLPGRLAWAATRVLAGLAIAVTGFFSVAATGALILLMAFLAVCVFIVAWYIAVPLVLAPYLLAYAGRRGELRADQQAAELGFARQLAEVLYHFQVQEEATKAALAAQGRQPKEPGRLSRLLSSHPDRPARIVALQPYLGLHR
ncbi:hypothetical protein ACE1SV_38020 [Streptomyces sp. E-15]